MQRSSQPGGVGNDEQRARAEYLKRHPELSALVALLKIEILKAKPDDIALFAANIFFSPHNRDSLEATIGMSLQKS
jgi:hypothetical protein